MTLWTRLARVLTAVPAACPIEQISFEELAAIFGTREGLAGPIRWGDLGAGDRWEPKLVVPFAPAGPLGVGADFFRQAVLGEGAFQSGVRRYELLRDLADEFLPDSRAMAVVPAVPSGVANLKIIPVAKGRGQRAIFADPETLNTGDYPLRLPVQLVFRPDRRRDLGALFDFLYSDGAARELERVDVVPVPKKPRDELRRRMQQKESRVD